MSADQDTFVNGIEILDTSPATSSSGSLFTFGGISILTTTNASVTSASFLTLGGTYIQGNTILGGNTIILSTTISTNATTGAFIVNGGIGVSGNLFGSFGNFSNIQATTGATIPNLLTTNASIPNLLTTNASIPNLITTTATIPNLITTNASIPNLITNTATIPNLITTSGTISNLNSANLNSANISSTNVISSNISATVSASIPNLIVSNASIGNLSLTSFNPTNITTNNLVVLNNTSIANSIVVNNTVTNSFITNSTVTNSFITNLNSTNLTVNSLNLTNLTSANAFFTNATTTNLVVTTRASIAGMTLQYYTGVTPGSWIDMPIGAALATGIGHGGPGVSPWVAYAGNAGYWFTNSAAGDICYRNVSGSLQFGTDPGISVMQINSNKTITINTTIDSTTTSTGALIIAGGLAIQKNLNIGGNAIISGNLTVNGTTVSVNSTTVNISDNIIVLNSGPSGTSDGGILVNRFQISNNTGLGDIANDTVAFTGTVQTGTSTSVVVLPSGASAVNSFYNNYWIKITSGTANNNVRQIVSYVGATRTATLSSVLTATPTVNTDTFNLYGNVYVANYFKESLNEFTMSYTSSTPGSVMTDITFANLRLGNLTSILTSTSNLVATNATITNFTLPTNITTTNLVSTNSSTGSIFGTNLNFTNATITNLNLPANVTFSNLVSTNTSLGSLIGTNLTFTNATITNSSFANLVGTNSSFANLVGTNSSTGSIFGTNLNFTNATITNLNLPANVTFSNLVSTNTSLGSLIGTNINFTNSSLNNLISTNITSTNIISTNSTISNSVGVNLNYTNITNTNLLSTNSTISNSVGINLNYTNITVANLQVPSLIITNLSLGNLVVNSVTAQNFLMSGITSASNVLSIDCQGSQTFPGQLIFTNSAGTGDFRIFGDGGDVQWQGGGGRACQMGAYHELRLLGGRTATTTIPFVAGSNDTFNTIIENTNNSIALRVQANGTQTVDLQQWTTNLGTVLSRIDALGNLQITSTADAVNSITGGSITTSGGISVAKSVDIGSTTNATNTSTGALTVSGGAGFNGDIYANNIFSNGVRANIWGSEYNFAFNGATAGTTSNAFQLRLSLTTGNLLGGTYHIHTGFSMFSSSVTTQNSEFRALLDATNTSTGTLLHQAICRPSNTAQILPFYKITTTTIGSGIHTLSIIYRNQVNGNVTNIDNTKITTI